jgi:hypothetical protein
VTILKINKNFSKRLKEWLLNFDHPVVSKGVKFLLKNCLSSGVNRFFFTILPFAIVLSQELKLAIIESYDENGRSSTLVRRKSCPLGQNGF